MKKILLFVFVILVTCIILFLFFDDSLIAKLSFMASVLSLIVAKIALYLQIKTDKDLKRIESNIEKTENGIQKLSEIQDKISFETEKNRLMDATKDSAVSKKNKKDIEEGIIRIFTESMFIISIEKDKREYHCEIHFIKESSKLYALPKMFYPFDRVHSFPFFCVSVSKVYLFKEESDIHLEKNLLSNFGIQPGKYYLHYHLSLSDKTQTGWHIAKRYPITQGLKFIFFYTSYGGNTGPSADEFCKSH